VRADEPKPQKVEPAYGVGSEITDGEALKIKIITVQEPNRDQQNDQDKSDETKIYLTPDSSL
jgi:hypothetical protein